MNSANQGFVQAFSRQRHGKITASSGTQRSEIASDDNQSRTESTQAVDSSGSNVSSNLATQSGLEIDESISGSASIWIDSPGESIARIDQAESELNGNHIVPDTELQVRSSVSLQHTLTAYGESSDDREPDCTEGAINRLQSGGLTETNLGFRAAWEVDALRIPDAVTRLFQVDGLFSEVGGRLAEAAETGLASLLVTSVHRHEGCTSVAIGLALSAALAGKKVALVDANRQSQTLADVLQIEIECGWQELSNAVSTNEIAIHSIQDGVTLFPSSEVRNDTQESDHIFQKLLENLRSSFDLIVIDGGDQNSLNVSDACGIDSAVVVQDVTRTERATVDHFSHWLIRAGINRVGVVENFA